MTKRLLEPLVVFVTICFSVTCTWRIGKSCLGLPVKAAAPREQDLFYLYTCISKCLTWLLTTSQLPPIKQNKRVISKAIKVYLSSTALHSILLGIVMQATEQKQHKSGALAVSEVSGSKHLLPPQWSGFGVFCIDLQIPYVNRIIGVLIIGIYSFNWIKGFPGKTFIFFSSLRKAPHQILNLSQAY